MNIERSAWMRRAAAAALLLAGVRPASAASIESEVPSATASAIDSASACRAGFSGLPMIDLHATDIRAGGPLLGLHAVRFVRSGARYGLPLTIYRGTVFTRTDKANAYFAVDDEDQCHLLSGDLDRLLGSDLGWEGWVPYSLAAFNAALPRGTEAAVHEQPVDYVGFVLSTVLPYDRIVILSSAADIPPAERRCRHAVSRRAMTRMAERLHAPVTVRVGDALRVVLFTWKDIGGAVVRCDAFVWPNGRIALTRRLVASHVGEHEDYLRVW